VANGRPLPSTADGKLSRPLPSPADGKLSSVFAVRRMMSSTRHYMAGSLSSATDGKLTKWVSSQEAQLDATCLLCRPRQTAKSPLPSVADGKEPAYWLFYLFFIKSNNFHHKYI